MFWLFATALTLTVALAILWPFWRAHAGQAEPAAAYDLRVYRDQLAEVDRDLARGIIAPPRQSVCASKSAARCWRPTAWSAVTPAAGPTRAATPSPPSPCS